MEYFSFVEKKYKHCYYAHAKYINIFKKYKNYQNLRSYFLVSVTISTIAAESVFPSLPTTLTKFNREGKNHPWWTSGDSVSFLTHVLESTILDRTFVRLTSLTVGLLGRKEWTEGWKKISGITAAHGSTLGSGC